MEVCVQGLIFSNLRSTECGFVLCVCAYVCVGCVKKNLELQRKSLEGHISLVCGFLQQPAEHEHE